MRSMNHTTGLPEGDECQSTRTDGEAGWVMVAVWGCLVIGAVCLVGGPVFAQSTANDWRAEGGSDDEALQKYREMLEEDPSEGYVLESLLNNVGRGAQLDRLIEDYRRRIDENPDDADLRLVLGHLLKAKRKWEEAIDQYDRAAEFAPERPQPYASRGDAYLQLRETDRAQADFERALDRIESADERERLLRKLANLSVQQRQFEAADTYYRRLIELKSGDRYLRQEYASTLMEAQQYERAADQFQRVVDASTNVGDRISALKSLGDAYKQMGRMEEAVATYRRGMSMVRAGNWRHAELRDRVIAVRRQQDRLEELVAMYRRDFGRPNYRQAMLLGRLHDEIGEVERAVSNFERARNLRPGDPEPREKLIELWRRQGDDDRVREGYRELVDVAPGESQYYFELVRLNMRRGDDDRARTWLNRIRRRFSRQPNVIVRVAETYLKYGWESGALEVYRQLTELEPDNPNYIISYGETLYRNGDLEEAVETWERLTQSRLDNADARARLGQVFSEHGMYERAITQYQKAVDERPDELEYRRGLASTFERAKKWRRAESTWREVLDRVDTPRKRSEARGRIIDIYRKQHRLRRKLDDFRSEFDGTESSLAAGYFLAEGHLQLGQFERALDVYKRLVEMDGAVDDNDVEALLALERIHRQRGNWEEAIEYLEELAELRPKHRPDYYHRIAEISLKLYRDEQAVEYAMRAVDANPQNADAYARLAEVYRKMGRIEEAIDAYREAWRLNDRAFNHAMELGELLEGRGDLREALTLYRRVTREADDRARILEAARRAIDLAEQSDRLVDLERSLAQLIFSGRQESVYRKVMLELYERMLSPWESNFQQERGESDEGDSTGRRGVASRAAPILVDALNSDDISQRAVAVRLLGELRDRSAAVPLARMVVDPSEPLRMAAAAALVRTGASRAGGALRAGLDVSDPEVREATIWAMGHVGGDTARGELMDVLVNGENSEERALAAVGLGRIGGEGVVAALRGRLSLDGAVSESLQIGIYWALGQLDDHAAVSTLATGLNEGATRPRTVAARSLGRIGGGEAVERLLQHLWTTDTESRRAARHGVRHLFVRRDGDDSVGRDVESEVQLLNTREQTFDAAGLFDSIAASARRRAAGELESEIFGDAVDEIRTVAQHRLKKRGRIGRHVVSDLVVGSEGLGLLSMQPPDDEQQRLYREGLSPLADDVRQWVVEAEGDRALGLTFIGHVAPMEHRDWLTTHLDHERPRVRAAAVRSVARMSDSTDGLARIRKRLDDESHLVRAAAFASLRAFSPGSIQKAFEGARTVWRSGLSDEAASVQVQAVRALAHLGTDRAIGTLVDGFPKLRRPAQIAGLRELSAMAHPKVRDLVEQYRTHWDTELRQAAAASEQ